MGLLRLDLLGWPEVRHDERAVSMRTRKALALLAYLAVEGGTHSREKLTALFWPESDDERGRATLRSTLAHLRDALGEPSAHLIATRTTLAFDTAAPHALDLPLLRAAAQARGWPGGSEQRQMAQTNVRATLAPLQMAARAIRGEFMEGFSVGDAPEFDDWIGLQRETCHRQATRVFDHLSRLQFHSGDVRGAIETTTRWLAIDRLGEAAYRRLMRLRIAAGDRSAALEVFERCRATLERELQAEPSPETAALAARLRQDRRALPLVDSSDDFQAITTPAAVGATSPLVGRAAEHLLLTDAYGAARGRQVVALLIEGEPGIGKSRLAQEFLAWAVAQGAEILQGRALETGGTLPYHPLVAALRARLGTVENLPSLLSGTWLAELSRLLPELRDQVPGLAPPLPVGDAEARLRLFEAVVRAGQALAARAPLVWCLDDLHWADTGSLDLLAYAARRWSAATPLLLLFAARTEELAAADAAVVGTSRAEWLAQLGRELPLTRVALGPLSREATGQLVAALTGTLTAVPPPEEVADWLFAETAGQPFYLVQTLRDLAEHGALRHEGEGGWRFTAQTAATVPVLAEGVRALIRSRLARLDRPAFAACVAGAVVGDGGDFETLRRVAGLAEEEEAAALEGLLRRGLFREREGRYYFTHDKLREVAYAEISGPRRRILHRRALATLQAAGVAPALLAHHALAGELPQEALRHTLAAGDDALRLFAVRSAIAHYEQARALRAALVGPPTTDDDFAHLCLQLGRAYEVVNDWAAASEVYGSLLAHGRAAGRADRECDALNRLATVRAQGSFDLAGAMGLLQEAQAAAERSGDELRLAETNWNQAQITFYAWQLEASLAYGERALVLARLLEQGGLIARCLNIIAYNRLMHGQIDETERYAAEGRRAAATLGDRVLEIDCLSIVAVLRVHSGAIAPGIAAAREGLALGQAFENPLGVANCVHPLVQGLLDAGDFDAALLAAREGVAAARGAGHPPTIVFNLLALGRVYRTAFALDQALQHHREALAIGEALHHPLLIEWGAIELAADHTLAEEWEPALQRARQALALRHHGRVYVGFARWCETEALLRGGEGDLAADDLAEAARRGPDFPRGTLQLQRGRAVLAAAADDLPGAVGHLTAAAALARDLGLLHDQWQADGALAGALLRLGDVVAAAQARARAATTVRHLADRIGDPGLRETFLTAPLAQRVLVPS